MYQFSLDWFVSLYVGAFTHVDDDSDDDEAEADTAVAEVSASRGRVGSRRKGRKEPVRGECFLY